MISREANGYIRSSGHIGATRGRTFWRGRIVWRCGSHPHPGGHGFYSAANSSSREFVVQVRRAKLEGTCLTVLGV